MTIYNRDQIVSIKIYEESESDDFFIVEESSKSIFNIYQYGRRNVVAGIYNSYTYNLVKKLPDHFFQKETTIFKKCFIKITYCNNEWNIKYFDNITSLKIYLKKEFPEQKWINYG